MAGGGTLTETVSIKGSLAEQQQERQQPVQSPVCVECGRPVSILFREYNKGNIRLGRCSYCRSVADKYIECEFVLIAIDLALHRVQAYRHLLFNMKPFSTHSFHGRLWQLGIAMAALDAHLRHTALSSEAAAAAAAAEGLATNSNGVGDPFWEAGGLLLAAVIEHACFAAGAVLYAASRMHAAANAKAEARRRRSHPNRCGNPNRDDGDSSRIRDRNDEVSPEESRRWEGVREVDGRADADARRGSGGGCGDGGVGAWRRGGQRHGGKPESVSDDDEDREEESYLRSLPSAKSGISSATTSSAAAEVAGAAEAASPGDVIDADAPQATKMYMAVVYPLFFRLLAAFVMIWDRQVAILNTIELLVATMQFVALSAVVGGPAAVSGMGEGGVAAIAICAGLASKMCARAILCFWFGSDPRTLRML